MTGAERILDERIRQIAGEGWTQEHDDRHDDGELAMAAVCYAAHAANEQIFIMRRTDSLQNFSRYQFEDPWPRAWHKKFDKRSRVTPSRTERIRELEKAGALIAAEIDRLLRQEERANSR